MVTSSQAGLIARPDALSGGQLASPDMVEMCFGWLATIAQLLMTLF